MSRRNCIVATLGVLTALLLMAAVLPQETAAPTPPEPAPTVQPTPKPLTLELVREVSFADVSADAPWHDAVSYAAYRGIMGGMGEGNWTPEAYADRACAVTALFRLSKAEDRPYAGEFADVYPWDWYASAAAWAGETGLLAGDAAGCVHPRETLDRAGLARLLYQYGLSQGLDVWAHEDIVEDYWDAEMVAQEDRPALAFCLERDIFGAFTDREVHPGYAVTRAQLAQVLVALEAYGGEPVAEQILEGTMLEHASRAAAAHDDLQAAIQAAARDYGAIGVQVAVLEQGRVTDAFAFGKAGGGQVMVKDMDNGLTLVVDMDAMNIYNKLRVASISKVVVAMNAMAMAEDGRLDLDGSIGQYWNCAAQNRAYPDTPVSIRSILSHTSSIPLYGDNTSRRYASVQRRLASRDFSGLQPGSIHSWGYNNYAFGVLGMTLELAGQQRYDAIADENFFLPLGIDAGVVPGELDHPERVATIYRHGGSVGRSAAAQRKMRYTYDPGDYGNYFCGGLTASAIDLAKLYAVLAGDGAFEGQRLLKAESVAAMETSLGVPYGQAFEQCYPLRLQWNIYGRTRLYYHTGSAYGVYNLASYDPDTGDGVVVLTTGASGAKDSRGIYAVCGEISRLVYAAIDRNNTDKYVLVEYAEDGEEDVGEKYIMVEYAPAEQEPDGGTAPSGNEQYVVVEYAGDGKE